MAILEATIDPTVPTRGLPAELVVSAEWDTVVEEYVLLNQITRKERQVPRINGITLWSGTSAEDIKSFVNMFPKVPVFVPATEQEQRDTYRTGRAPAEVVTINQATWLLRKNVPIMVPTPIAEVVQNKLDIFRTDEAKRNVGKQEYTPLPAGTPFDY